MFQAHCVGWRPTSYLQGLEEEDLRSKPTVWDGDSQNLATDREDIKRQGSKPIGWDGDIIRGSS